MTLEQKFCATDSVVTMRDGALISGYASVFGQADQGGDIVQAGAFRAVLAQGRKIKMLWQHDPAQPIGVWDTVREDAKGLFVSGRLLVDVARGREAASLIAAGALDGLSIGYRTIRAQKDASGARHLHELDLWEVSLVTFPMLPQARIAAKDDSADAPDLRGLARAFDHARAMLPRL